MIRPVYSTVCVPSLDRRPSGIPGRAHPVCRTAGDPKVESSLCPAAQEALVDVSTCAGAYSAPMTVKSLLTKTWCGQLTAIMWTS